MSVRGPRAGMGDIMLGFVAPSDTCSSTAQTGARQPKRRQTLAYGAMPSTPGAGRGITAPVPDAARRRRDPGHLRRPGPGAGAVRRAALHPDRRPPAVPHRGGRAGELHPRMYAESDAKPRPAEPPGDAPAADRSRGCAPQRRQRAERHHLDRRRRRGSPDQDLDEVRRRPGPARPARVDPSARCSSTSARSSATPRSAEPSPSRAVTGRAGGGDRPASARPRSEPTAASHDQPVRGRRRRAGTSRPPPAPAGRRARRHPPTSSSSRAPTRRVQPGGEVAPRRTPHAALLGDLARPARPARAPRPAARGRRRGPSSHRMPERDRCAARLSIGWGQTVDVAIVVRLDRSNDIKQEG